MMIRDCKFFVGAAAPGSVYLAPPLICLVKSA
jgi:hypothetical protein